MKGRGTTSRYQVAVCWERNMADHRAQVFKGLLFSHQPPPGVHGTADINVNSALLSSAAAVPLELEPAVPLFSSRSPSCTPPRYRSGRWRPPLPGLLSSRVAVPPLSLSWSLLLALLLRSLPKVTVFQRSSGLDAHGPRDPQTAPWAGLPFGTAEWAGITVQHFLAQFLICLRMLPQFHFLHGWCP